LKRLCQKLDRIEEVLHVHRANINYEGNEHKHNGEDQQKNSVNNYLYTNTMFRDRPMFGFY